MDRLSKNAPLVVIFGRANVGKSTLLNRLAEKRIALTSRLPGTTRDSNAGLVRWRGRTFTFVDTGGIDNFGGASDDILEQVKSQALGFVKRADCLLFLVDVRDGLLPVDQAAAKWLKRNLPANTPLVLAANKMDGPRRAGSLAEFYRLNLGEPLPVSAINGSGTGDLLDRVSDALRISGRREKTAESDPLKPDLNIAIIGQPNVGKSSLVNALLKEKRLITSARPHTTREPRDIAFVRRGRIFRLIDTAGISRQGQKKCRAPKNEDLARRGIGLSLATLKRSDVALLIIDISRPLVRQDADIAGQALRLGKSLIITANKWDLVKEKDTKKFTADIRDHLPFADWAPVRFVSALTGAKVDALFDLLEEIREARFKLIPQSALNGLLKNVVSRHRPVQKSGARRPRLYEIAQSGANPPVFTVRIGAADSLADSYLRFIANRLREKFGFTGTPILIKIKRGRN